MLFVTNFTISFLHKIPYSFNGAMVWRIFWPLKKLDTLVIFYERSFDFLIMTRGIFLLENILFIRIHDAFTLNLYIVKNVYLDVHSQIHHIVHRGVFCKRLNKQLYLEVITKLWWTTVWKKNRLLILMLFFLILLLCEEKNFKSKVI